MWQETEGLAVAVVVWDLLEMAIPHLQHQVKEVTAVQLAERPIQTKAVVAAAQRNLEEMEQNCQLQEQEMVEMDKPPLFLA
jgi:FMN-dependent NADH-azoreductase